MPFYPCDFDPLDQLTSKKLQQLADNYEFLRKRKVVARAADVDPLTPPNPVIRDGFIQDNLAVFAEYRDISPGDAFPDEQGQTGITDRFEKEIWFPSNFFDPNHEPVVVSSIGAKGGALRRINHVQTMANAYRFKFRILENVDGSNFTESMPFFITYIAIGPAKQKKTGARPYEAVNFAKNEELTTSKINTMINNSDYLIQNRMTAWMRNVDPITNNPRSAIPIIKDNLAIYSEYKEFVPGPAVLNADGSAKQAFDKTFMLPGGFFNPLYKPVVVATLGIDPGQATKIGMVLRRISSESFTISVMDNNPTKTLFGKNTQMMITYTVVGVKGDA